MIATVYSVPCRASLIVVSWSIGWVSRGRPGLLSRQVMVSCHGEGSITLTSSPTVRLLAGVEFTSMQCMKWRVSAAFRDPSSGPPLPLLPRRGLCPPGPPAPGPV